MSLIKETQRNVITASGFRHSGEFLVKDQVKVPMQTQPRPDSPIHKTATSRMDPAFGRKRSASEAFPEVRQLGVD